MHELALAHNLLETVIRTAAQAGDCTVQVIRLRVGGLSCVEPDALSFAFAALSQGTLAASARLEFERVPVKLRCLVCGREGIPEDPLVLVCPACGRRSVELIEGRDILLSSIQVDAADEPASETPCTR